MFLVGFYYKNYSIALILNRIIKHLTLDLLTTNMYISSPALLVYLYVVFIEGGLSFNLYLQNSELYKTWIIMLLKFFNIFNKIVVYFKPLNRSILFQNVEIN